MSTKVVLTAATVTAALDVAPRPAATSTALMKRRKWYLKAKLKQN